MNKYFIIIFTIGLSLSVFGQNEKSESPKNNVQITSQKEVKDKVIKQLKEIFGDEYKVMIEDRPDQMQFFTDFYLRCEYIPIDEAPSGLRNISSLDLFDKYNPGKIQHDNLNEFNADKFNVLKYRFNYYNKEDQYFRVYNTDTVLKINKL